MVFLLCGHQKFCFLFFAQKRPNLAFLVIWCPVGGLVGGCGAQAVSRKTHIYFTITDRGKFSCRFVTVSWTVLNMKMEQEGKMRSAVKVEVDVEAVMGKQQQQ